MTIGPVAIPTLEVQGAMFIDNRAIGGVSGNGVRNPNPFTGGGFASGGAICALSDTMLNVSWSTFFGNQAIAGAGGAGGEGGWGTGGAIVCGNPVSSATGSVAFCMFVGNVARGGAGGLGGNGGLGFGGGIYHAGAILTVSHSIITGNRAQGGAAGVGGGAGLGIGGGVFNAGTISIDALDLIFGNEADLSEDCYGC